MDYTKRVWSSRDTEFQDKFIIVDNGDGTFTLTPDEGIINSPGTAFTPAAMNNIEDGIEGAFAEIERPEEVVLNTIEPITSLGVLAQEGIADVKMSGRSVQSVLGNKGDTLDNVINLSSRTESIDNGYIKAINDISIGSVIRISDLKTINNTSYYFLASDFDNTGNPTPATCRLVGDGTTSGTNLSFVEGNEVGMVAAKFTPVQIQSITPILNNVSIDVYGPLDTPIGSYIRVKNVRLCVITEDDYNTLTLDELLVKYPYVDGLASVENPVVESVGKNLFDKTNYKKDTMFSVSTLDYAPSIGFAVTNPVRVYPGMFIKSNQGDFYTDANWGHKYTDLAGNVSPLFLTAGTLVQVPDYVDGYVEFNTYRVAHDINEFMVEETLTGTVTTYEPHKHTQLSAPTELHSLPNGVKDTLELVNGKWLKTKRVGKTTLKATDISSLNLNNVNVDLVVCSATISDSIFYSIFGDFDLQYSVLVKGFTANGLYADSLDTIGLVYSYSGGLVFAVPKGTYTTVAEAQADLTGTKVLYELATPIIEEIGVQGALKLFSNGTLYNSSDIFQGEIEVTYPTTVYSKLDAVEEQAIINAYDNARYKSGNDNYPSGVLTYTVTDPFVTENTRIIVTILGGAKAGWEVDSYNGYFTIITDAVESAAVNFNWDGVRR